MFLVPAAALYVSPTPIFELAGSANSAIASSRYRRRSVHPRLGRERLNVVAHGLQVDRPVVDPGLARLFVHPHRRVLQPVLVVALGIVLVRMRASAFLAIGSRADGRLGLQDQVLKL